MTTEDQNYSYNIVWTDGEPVSVTVFDRTNGESYVATSTHPEFTPILLAIRFGEPVEAIRDLFDKARAIDAKFKRLSERVTVRAGNIYFDGVQVHGALVDTIVSAHESGEQDFQPLVNFMEKIETNPNPHSKDHLFRWLTLKGFSITADGDIIAYKGIGADDLSITAGTAIVDGEVVTGRIPNKSGSVVEMPRNEVTFDPANGCSTGLHAATYSFANNFGHKVVALKVNPRDVVSVPVDSGDQKMRVCRYVVLQAVDGPIDDVVLRPSTAEELGIEDEEVSFDDVVPTEDLTEPLVVTEDMAIDGTRAEDTEPEEKPFIEYRKADFQQMTHQDMRKLAKQWKGNKGASAALGAMNPTKDALVSALSEESRRMRKNRTRPRKTQ